MRIGTVEILNMDNLEYMRGLDDKSFDLAIVDPPYGIGQNWSKDRKGKFYKHRNEFNNAIPGPEYFNELFRVSRHQIIWGANYYWNFLPPSNNLIYWRKFADAEKQFMSAGELAWTSITKYPLIEIGLPWVGFIRCERIERIHPHQKPVKLYDWTLEKFAQDGWRILDTHLGSGSSALSALSKGFDFVGLEKDENYFKAAAKRLTSYRPQGTLTFENAKRVPTFPAFPASL